LVKLFIGLGLLLFSGGIGAALYGLPYLVLEYGFTLVIGGIVGATGGLVLIGMGVLLKEVRRVGLKLTGSPQQAAIIASTKEASPPVVDQVDTLKPDSQGELFEPGVAAGIAKTALATAAVGGAAFAASRVSPFDKIERALEDVLETTRGDAKVVSETDETGRDSVNGGLNASREEQAGIRTLSFADGETRAETTDRADQDEVNLPGLPLSEVATIRSDPSAEPSSPDYQPVSSDEGVVRVYTIGDSSFTMYKDGTIRANTPQGMLTFSTMDELKTYLDQRPVASSAKA
jgi:hypothetical protein